MARVFLADLHIRTHVSINIDKYMEKQKPILLFTYIYEYEQDFEKANATNDIPCKIFLRCTT